MPRYGDLDTQYLDSAGDPLVSGKIAFKESGTNDDKNTYADENETILNTNPLILNADGTQPNCFFTGTAKTILYTADDVQIRTLDPDFAAGGSATSAVFPSWTSTNTYSAGNIVVGSNGLNYKCIVVSSQGNDPTITASDWSQYKLTGVWNTNESYSDGDIVQASNGSLYEALSSQSGNDPISDKVSWRPLSSQVYSAAETYIIGEVVSDSAGLMWRSLVGANTGNTPSASPTQWSAVVTKAMVVLSSVTASNDATIDIVLPSGYGDYELHLSNWIPASTSSCQMRTSTDGGSTFDSGATDYAYNLIYAGAVSTVSTGNTQIILSGGNVNASATIGGLSAVITISKPSESVYTKISWVGGYDSNGTVYDLVSGSGMRKSAADVDAIRLLFSTGNISSGTATLYGLNES